MSDAPWMWIVAGPDGAGKSTLAGCLFDEHAQNDALIDAEDAYAATEDRARADKVLAARLYARIAAGLPFAVEHPLDDGLMLEAIYDWHQRGGLVGLVWLWLDGAGPAIERVRVRADAGGTFVESAEIRARFVRVRRHLHAYLDAVDGWLIMDNAGQAPSVVAEGGRGRVHKFDAPRYHVIVGARADRPSDRPIFTDDWSRRAEAVFREAVRQRLTLERLLHAAR